MVEDILKDHERRIIRLEECYRSMDEKMDSMKTDISKQLGRFEKSIDRLTEKVEQQGTEGSSTKAQVSIVLSFLTPLITGIIVFFLTRR